MKVLNKIIEIILNILIFIIFILVVIAGTYAVQTKILKKDYANMLGYTGFEVITGSMSGTIEIGDVVIVKLVKNVNTEIKTNDIIVYKQGESFVTHRTIEIKQNTIFTKGDANNGEDKEIQKEQVVGKVIYILPKVSLWKKVLTTPVVSISIITTIILFGFAYSYESKDTNNEKNEESKNGKQKKN